MTGRIPPAFIDELLARVDIVELVDSRIPLRKGGRDYKACCPFHDEKSPSFTVSQSKQFYHCFGCGAHGSAIGFLMEYDGLEFLEAIEELANRAGMQIPHDEHSKPVPAAQQQSRALYEVLEQANRYYKQQLRVHQDAEQAKTYLKLRGMSGKTAAAYEIGFAPAGWDSVLRALGTNAEQIALLRAAGLVTDGSSTYDRFRNRIMFPIRNRRGKVIGFGGRTIDNDTPKYLNSPETPVFHKGHELYGLFNVRQLRKAPPRLLVVEGYMDVVMLAEHGIDYAVASLGTAATVEQIQQLLRANDEIVFCFDGDEAGRRAAWRALENTMPTIKDAKRVSFMFLPDGEDPDSLVRKEGAELFQARIAGARALSEYLFETLLGQIEGRGLEQRARLVELARPLIAPVQAPAIRLLLLASLGDLSGLGERVSGLVGRTTTPANRAADQHLGGVRDTQHGPGTQLHRGADTIPATRLGPQAHVGGTGADTSKGTASKAAMSRSPGAARGKGTLSPVRKALTLLVNDPTLATRLGADSIPAHCEAPGIALLERVIEALQDQPKMSVAMLTERFRDDSEGRFLCDLVDPDLRLDDALVELLGCFERLQEQTRRARFDALAAKDRHGLLSEEEHQELKQLAGAVGHGSRARANP